MRQPIRITFLAKRALYAKGGLAKKKRERERASMALMVSEIRFALLERTKRLVTPTEERVSGGLLGVGKEMLGVGRGKARDGNSNRVSGQIHISACKKINQQASPECWGHSCNVKLEDQAHLQGECRGLGR